MPRLSATGLFFAVASLGMPGLGNFAGEFLVLLATWHVSPVIATLTTVGLVLAAIYALRMVNRVFLAAPKEDRSIDRFGNRAGMNTSVARSVQPRESSRRRPMLAVPG